MKSKYQNYSVGDLVSERSFINYCLNSNEGDEIFWNDWILHNPEHIKDINQAKDIVIKYSLGLAEPELSSERNRFIKSLDAVGTEDQDHLLVPNKKSVWTYLGRIAAVLLVAVGIVFTIKYISDSPPQLPLAVTKTIKQNPAGQKSTIYLSDGTKVILNAQSKLVYNEQFGTEKREVSLVGEAFFEVTKDTNKPFIVKSADLVTTVLGTSFNVNAYPEKNETQVAVITGKVAVEATSIINEANTAQKIYLLPSEMATYSASDNTLIPSTFSPEEITSWKDGIIYFKNTDEKLVLNKLEKWYGVEIESQNKSPRKWDITAEYDNLSLENVLQSLSYAASFDFSINKKKVILTYKN
jgi:transmembrane sensor